MAVPRVFISSTCYDLQEIRNQLRAFIEDMGYDPIMSEYGDIFYDISKHVQDSCKQEIEKCQMFILIIGNQYGSYYHKQIDNHNIPNSVTLEEFKKSLEIGIPKYIFINRFVKYDYDNYKHKFKKKLNDYFSKNYIDDNQIELTKKEQKEEYDKTYSFPQDVYKYIFYFLDIIDNLDINNAYYPFESFDEIKDNLRKQWAGLVYDSLTKEKTVALEHIENLNKRFDKIEDQLRRLADSKKVSPNDNGVIFDINELTTTLKKDDLASLQEKIDSLLTDILYFESVEQLFNRITFNTFLDEKKMALWYENLALIVHNYK